MFIEFHDTVLCFDMLRIAESIGSNAVVFQNLDEIFHSSLGKIQITTFGEKFARLILKTCVKVDKPILSKFYIYRELNLKL